MKSTIRRFAVTPPFRAAGGIPRSDVEFLQAAVKRMNELRLSAYTPHHNRGAAALILRFHGEAGNKVAKLLAPIDRASMAPLDLLQRLRDHSDPGIESELTLLFLKRRDVDDNRWSGKVTFPSSKRDEKDDRDDLDSVIRYAKYALGMPLDTPDFLLLGRMRDTRLLSRRLRESVVMSQFVFLHLGDLTPSVTFAHGDVEAVHWVPLRALDRRFVVRHRIQFPLNSYLHTQDAHQVLWSVLRQPNIMLRFPSISLPSGLGDLWGASLSHASDFLRLDGRRRCDWPVLSSSNLFLEWLMIKPAHGYMELRYRDYRCEIDPVHVGSFFLVVCGAVTTLYLIGWMTVSFALACRVALEYIVDFDAVVARRPYRVGRLDAVDVTRLPTADIEAEATAGSDHRPQGDAAEAEARRPAVPAETQLGALCWSDVGVRAPSRRGERG